MKINMKLITDTRLLFLRNIKKTFRSPWWLIGLSQPVLYLLLYMPLLKNINGPTPLTLGQIAQIFVPGMLVIMGVSSLFAGFGFIPEIREGLIARWLVSPVSRLSILLSLILNQMVSLTLQATALFCIAIILGLRVSVIGTILTFILILLIGTTMASFSYIISIATRSEDGLASLVNTLYLPIMLLSGIMLPISLAPQWLKTAALFNPFYYAVEASRALFAGNFNEIIIPEGFVIMIVFVVVAVWLAVRSLRRMAA